MTWILPPRGNVKKETQTLLIAASNNFLKNNYFKAKINCKEEYSKFSISTQFSSIWPIERTLSGATTPGQSGHGSDGNERILRIPQSSRITGASLWDCLVSLVGGCCWGWGSYPSAERQSLYSADPANWDTGHSMGRVLTLLQRYSRCIQQPRHQPTGQKEIGRDRDMKKKGIG